jgi:dTDP-4-dehydrorhamnose 3,5-epimerase-like enzyme
MGEFERRNQPSLPRAIYEIMNGPQIINLPKFLDARGNLSFIEQEKHIPFVIKRAYWIYDVPGGECRGGHAYRNNEEFIISLSGSFDVVLNDGTERKVFSLNRSYHGLYVPKGLWREMENFSTNSLALILSSTDYDAHDYIRDYDEFLKLKRNGEI